MEQSRTAYVVLGILSIEGSKSGYDIRKAIETSVSYFWGESYGQIYPALKCLAEDGLIAPVPSAAGSRKRRQEYSITDAGRAALRAWLALPFQNDPPRNEFLLKLFFGREASPSVTLGHVRELQRRNQQALELLRQMQAAVPAQNANNPHLPYWMLTLELGIAMTRAALEWGDSALARLATAEANAPGEPLLKQTD